MTTKNTPRELLEKGFIREDQFQKIEVINSGKVVSVFYELQTLLYLGVLLFTTGVGILIYMNIGSIGHLVSIAALIILTRGCFYYAFKNGAPYSNDSIKPITPYFDYVVLLGALVFISVAGYLQFQFGILNENLELVSLITSVFFFYVAYRFDHLGVLSLAITALASFCSVSISPHKWYSGNFFESSNLHQVAIAFGLSVAIIALLLERKRIKTHFTFTYLNSCSLLFFAGAITGLFMGDWWFAYLVLIYGGCVFAYTMAKQRKSFLFLLYAFICAYIGTTYLLDKTILGDNIEIWFLYSILSCGGFIFFIIKYKNYFKQKS
ncbi:MAG: DUF2157 domain-containing protein [Flammeovirgaceae bacterium]